MSRQLDSRGAVLFAVVLSVAAFARVGAQQRPLDDANLTYKTGQPVVPIYSGYEENADGTFTMHFAYINRNYEEELYIPIGPDNNVSPAPFGPDAGQPTYFLPRNNRWQFTIKVPADFGNKDVVWTLTSKGQTYRVYGSLKPGYVLDEDAIVRLYTGGSGPNNMKPVLKVDGEKVRTARVGVPVRLTAIATDDAKGGRAGFPVGRPRPRPELGNSGPGGLRTAQGLTFVWFQYRGGPRKATFDPPQFDAWENVKWNSPWAYGWPLPPIPPDNTWVVNATFPDPGTYVLRARAFDGAKWATEDITFHVTP
jgi:hypothetical protein